MTALDPLLAIAVAQPCVVGAPLLHRLVDGELSSAMTRTAAEHATRCPTCRDHLRWLELEQQTVREIAAPTPERFVALWSDRLRQRLVAAIADEAGAELVRAAACARGASARGGAAAWSRSLGYLRQLAGWLGRADLERRRGASGAAILAGFAELMGDAWPPLLQARSAILDSRSAIPDARRASIDRAKSPISGRRRR